MQPQNESADWWPLGHLIYSCYEGEYLLQPAKLCVKDILVEIDHRLQMIKDGNEPVINKMIKGGHADVAEFVKACLKRDAKERTFENIIITTTSYLEIDENIE
ncbi:16256_t:CDS:2, partial [Funneliformis geosporum]